MVVDVHDVTINNGMDLAQFRTLVTRTVRDAMVR
jgi:hypothetical protein